MDVGVNPLVPRFLQDLYLQCLQAPHHAKGLIQKNIAKNRSLSSKYRKMYHHWILQGLRWNHVYDGLITAQGSFEMYEQAVAKQLAHVQREVFVTAEEIAKQLGFPLWVVEALAEQYLLAQVQKILLGFYTPSDVFLRMNIYLAAAAHIKQSLCDDGILFEDVDTLPCGLRLLAKAQVTKTQAYKKGWVEIQDYGSQFIVDQMQLGEKLNIIDGCCRTGGKSLAMQNYIQGKSTIHAVDIDDRVFVELHKRITRTSAEHIKTYCVSAQDPQPLPKLVNKADRVLVDAPCSSMGTLKSRPWLKYQYQASDIHGFAGLQLDILCKQAGWVKKGGLLIYSVCSVLPHETQHVIKQFMHRYKEYTQISENFLLPHETSGDGFYVAVLKN